MCPSLFLPTTAERLRVSDFHCIWHPFISLTQRKWEVKTTNGPFSEWEWSSHVYQVERGTVEKCKGSVDQWQLYTFSLTCLFSAFLRISGSVPSTKDGNSREKTSTFKKCTVQVTILAIFLIKKKTTFPRQPNLDNSAFVFPTKSNLQFFCFTSLNCLILQNCLRQHYGRKAKKASSSLKAPSCSHRKTSPSDTSSKRMWAVLQS